ncbi:hypothetical protein [Clostridium sp.]|uniref:hypothetical protein n=1 Tax=Clostridium sp. TaxID=1506 RepID=UPI0026180624|nr:hypothetical protein [Clostridium sp.]
MYVAFGNRVLDSQEIKKDIEQNTDAKVVSDLCKSSKREDIIAYKLSIDMEILRGLIKENLKLKSLNDEELFEDYLDLAEEVAGLIYEYVPEDAVLDIRSYKWDITDDDVKLIMVMAHEDLGIAKVNDVMKRLLRQVD